MTPVINAIAHIAEGIQHAVAGRPLDAVRSLADAALEIVPTETARQVLDEAAIRRANARADEAERLKFGGGE